MTAFPLNRRATIAAVALTIAGAAAGVSATIASGATIPARVTTTSANTVRAVETEYHIALSRKSVAAGRYTISAINDGTVEHGLVINGPGVRDKPIGIVEPGHSASKVVTLRKGRYDIFCPISDHKMRGMNTHLTVR